MRDKPKLKYLDEITITRRGKNHKITKMPLFLRLILILHPVWRVESDLLTCRYKEYKDKLYWVSLKIKQEIKQ
jgi:hypothetical protein